MAQLITENLAAFHKGNALARCQQIFARQKGSDSPWLSLEDHDFVFDLMAHHPDYTIIVASDEIVGMTTTRFLNLDCFVVVFHEGEEVMIDHLDCIDCLFD